MQGCFAWSRPFCRWESWRSAQCAADHPLPKPEFSFLNRYLMAYCAVPAILRERHGCPRNRRLTDANAGRKEQGNVRVSDLLFNRVHPAIYGDSVVCRRSTRALVAPDERASVAARDSAAAK